MNAEGSMKDIIPSQENDIIDENNAIEIERYKIPTD
jgi:hypothetical protein